MVGSSKIQCKKWMQNITKTTYKIWCSGNCKGYYHCKCVGVSDFDVRVMVKEKKHWFCKKCEEDSPCQSNRQSMSRNQPNTDGIQLTQQSLCAGNSSNSPGSNLDNFTMIQLIEEVKKLREDMQHFRTSMDFFNDKYEEQKK